MSDRLFPVQQEQLTPDDYYTPPWVFDRMAIRFDLDVCAPPGGVEWVPADRYYDQAADGLAQPWEGRVWMNPPYSNPTPWVNKFIAHRHGVALFIHSKARWNTALWREAGGYALLPPPVVFVGANNAMPWPMSMAAFGDECVEAIARLGVVRRIA